VPRVLVVDDDASLLSALRIGLSALGHEVTATGTAAAGLAETAVGRPDVVVLDLGLPDMDGLAVCTRLRQWTDVPVIVLSADHREQRKIAVLDAGADDYMTKPFGMRELDARVRLALRHRRRGDAAADEADDQVVRVGSLRLDLGAHEATYDGRTVALTNREFALLAFLARHPGRVCTHGMLIDAVWGSGYPEDAENLRTHMYRLRRKLGDDGGELVRTRPGVGYQLVDPVDDVATVDR